MFNLSEETIKMVEQDTGMSIHELRTTPIKELSKTRKVHMQ